MPALIELHDPAEVDGVRAILDQHAYAVDTLDRRGAFPYNVIALADRR